MGDTWVRAHGFVRVWPNRPNLLVRAHAHVYTDTRTHAHHTHVYQQSWVTRRNFSTHARPANSWWSTSTGHLQRGQCVCVCVCVCVWLLPAIYREVILGMADTCARAHTHTQTDTCTDRRTDGRTDRQTGKLRKAKLRNTFLRNAKGCKGKKFKAEKCKTNAKLTNATKSEDKTCKEMQR